MEIKKKYNFIQFLKELNESNLEFKTAIDRLGDEMMKLFIKQKNGTNINVYSAEMFFILKADLFKNEGFIDEYEKGFNDGKLHFKEEHKEDVSGIWANNLIGYTEKLRHAYFENAINHPHGYKKTATSFYESGYIDMFYKIGFASGIVNEIDLMADNNPTLFCDYENEENENPYPFIFVGTNSDVYDRFIEYSEKHIIDFYIDYSYLKKRLEKEKLIHNIKDNDFMKTLFEKMCLISQANYDCYLEKYESKLRSLGKSYNTNRENNFNNIFEV